MASMFHLTATLCQDRGTPRIEVMLDKNLIPAIVPHNIFEAN
jgi:hypothetical protein